MSAFNSARTYGWIARWLHWLIASAVVGLFVLAIWYRSLEYGHPWYEAAPALHISIGFVLIIVAASRLIWGFINTKPDNVGQNAFENRLATLMHWALHLSLIALVASGYLYATADGRPAEMFGIIDIPALPVAKSLKGAIGWIHEYLSYGLIALASLHAIAALKHHFVDRDDTLRRMVYGSRTLPQESESRETLQ